MPEEPEIDTDQLNERIHEELEYEGGDVAALEQQISRLTSSADFQTWSERNVSAPRSSCPAAPAPLIQSPESLYSGRLNMCCKPCTSCRRSSSAWLRPDESHRERQPIARLAPAPLLA